MMYFNIMAVGKADLSSFQIINHIVCCKLPSYFVVKLSQRTFIRDDKHIIFP